ISDDPYTAIHYIISGILYEARHQQNLAYFDYAKAMAYSPSILRSKFAMERRNRDQGQFLGAVQMCISYLNELPESPMKTAAMANLLDALDDDAAARMRVEEVLTDLPDLPLSWNLLGRIEEAEGNNQSAEEAFRKTLFLDRTNSVAHAELAKMDAASGRDQEGLSMAF